MSDIEEMKKAIWENLGPLYEAEIMAWGERNARQLIVLAERALADRELTRLGERHE